MTNITTVHTVFYRKVINDIKLFVETMDFYRTIIWDAKKQVFKTKAETAKLILKEDLAKRLLVTAGRSLNNSVVKRFIDLPNQQQYVLLYIFFGEVIDLQLKRSRSNTVRGLIGQLNKISKESRGDWLDPIMVSKAIEFDQCLAKIMRELYILDETANSTQR